MAGWWIKPSDEGAVDAVMLFSDPQQSFSDQSSVQTLSASRLQCRCRSRCKGSFRTCAALNQIVGNVTQIFAHLRYIDANGGCDK